MWGHVYTKWVSVDINYGWLGEYETARRIYYKCKHCGKMLQHPNRIESP